MNDNDKIKELIKLSEKNPELKILTMTYYEVICEDWGYWSGSIEKIEKDFYWHDDDRMYFGMSDIKEQIGENLANSNPDYMEISNEDFEELLKKEVELKKDLGEIKEAIIIFIGLPD